MRSKGSQVHSQFNWLYILIVGGFFIILFFTMSTRQVDTVERRISASALEGISNIFEAARTGTSMSATVNVPDLKIEFLCESRLFGDNIYSEYRVGGFSRRMDGLPTFVPGDMEGDNLVTWTQTWELPIPVMNFLYIANSRTRFFFVRDESFSDIYSAIEDSFSSNMRAEFVESEDPRFADFNDLYSIIVVFTESTSEPTELLEYVDETFSGFYRLVQVVPESINFGRINIYEDMSHVGEMTYAGRASLYGAIFAPDESYYECSMRKAIERLGRVACIHHHKHKALREHYSGDVQCRNVYDGVVESFYELFGDDFCRDTEGGIDLGDVSMSFEDNYEDIKRFYNSMEDAYGGARRFSCARPY